MAKVIQLKDNNGNEVCPNVLDLIYPVGTIYETTSEKLNTVAKMNAHFGGTWEKYGNGRVTVCHTSTSSNFNTIGKTGGSEDMQQHYHKALRWGNPTGTKYSTTGVSGNEAMLDLKVEWKDYSPTTTSQMVTSYEGTGNSGNLQPYIVVYRYRRIG